MTARAKTRLFYLIGVLACGVSIELACRVFFHAQVKRFIWADPASFTAAPAQSAEMSGGFDARLGWTPKFKTPFEERPRPRSFGEPHLAVFGNSFTLGSEIADADTWQSVLSERLGADVFNFGVGGYAPDQILLRYLGTKAPRTPVVAFELALENLNRALTSYRKFYLPRTTQPLTKPRFELLGDRLSLLPNPIQRREDLRKLEDPAFIAELARNDPWYQRIRLPELRFPYARLLFHPGIWKSVLYTPTEMNGAPKEDVWKEEKPRKLVLAMIDEFTREAKARGQIPFVIVSPSIHEIRELTRGKNKPGLEAILAHCRESNLLCLDGPALLLQKSKLQGQHAGAYFKEARHLNPLGQKAFAEIVEEFLTAHNLLPTRLRATEPL